MLIVSEKLGFQSTRPPPLANSIPTNSTVYLLDRCTKLARWAFNLKAQLEYKSQLVRCAAARPHIYFHDERGHTFYYPKFVLLSRMWSTHVYPGKKKYAARISRGSSSQWYFTVGPATRMFFFSRAFFTLFCTCTCTYILPRFNIARWYAGKSNFAFLFLFINFFYEKWISIFNYLPWPTQPLIEKKN